MITTSANYDSYLGREQIFPKWKLLSFSPDADSWAEIIEGTYGQTPVDLTSYVISIDYNFDRLTVNFSDTPDLLFHPDSGTLKAALKQGRIIRLYEGFEGLDEAEWLVTFSGTVEGTYSWQFQRGETIVGSFQVFSRANNQAWKRRSITSNSYTVGSDWGEMFRNIAEDVMLLEPPEFAVADPWGVLFDKNSNQVVNYPPWDALSELAFGINAVPWFNGKGQLSLYYTSQDRITQALSNDNYLRRYDSKGASAETNNKVILTYLSNTLSRVDGPDQLLGSAIVTTGFFRESQSIDVYYSDDHKTRSDNPRMLVKQSANSGLISFCSESMTKFDEFHVRIDVDVSVWAPLLATAMIAFYFAATYIGDIVEAAGFGYSTGFTIPFGRIFQTIALVAILLIMMCLGTGVYEIWGTPYELVYLEQQTIAIKSDTEFWQEREVDIRNDFISTVEQAQPLAINQLNFEVMKEQPRTVILRYDPRIEPGDIIQLSSSVKVWVESVSRSITRGSNDVSTMTLNCYRTVV